MWRITSEWRNQMMLFGKLSIFIFIFLCFISPIVQGDTTCLSSWKYIKVGKSPEEDQCDEKSWRAGVRPDLLNIDFSYCTRKIILDLSSRFTSTRELKELQYFLRDSMQTCFRKTSGHNFYVTSFEPGLNVGSTEFSCCAMDVCRTLVDGMESKDYLKQYDSDALVYEDPEFNKKYVQSWIDLIKVQNWQKCKFNSMVFITNRIIDITATNDSDYIYNYFSNTLGSKCVELTIILVAREDSTRQILSNYYANLTTNLYAVPDVNCLRNLVGCLLPCITRQASDCAKEELNACEPPTIPPSTTTTTTPQPTAKYPNSMYVMYIFSLSSKISLKNFDDIRDHLVSPIKTFIQEENSPVTFAFYLPANDTTDWLTNADEAKDIQFTDGDRLDVSHPTDRSIPYTESAIKKAIQHYNALKNSTHWSGIRFLNPASKPIIILLTDYVSETFLEEYHTSLNRSLNDFTFRIYTYNNYTFEYFKVNQTVPLNNLYWNDVDHLQDISLNGTQPKPIPVVPPELSKLELVLIIVGSCVLCLIILIIVTILCRQRMTWMKKIERFRNKHQETEPPIMEDYWELSWDRLLIKSEKIGSGAYGQVFRGKMHGKPPCAEHFYSDRPHLAGKFENCDVAIKMLPKYASDSARKEFMNEIELMKSIGYNENIVNMLGCITVGQAICLVLEYCPNRDLLQYVKAMKIDVNISKSMDIKINYTKEFMLFAWQIADGMRYLASKHIIHRDLAARNILIDSEKNAKISDFGLCIMLDENYSPMTANKSFISASGRLPIKWLSIEALTQHTFSTKSDIWSFGMLLFECYSFGETPFNDIPPRRLVEHLQQGNRPEKPVLCSDEMYELMERCWEELPEKRPTFQELLTQLTLFLERATEGYGYLQLLAKTPEEYTKMNKIALAKSFGGSDSPNLALNRQKARIFSSNSNASEHRPKHKTASNTVSGKISKRNSHSSNQIHDVEKSPIT